MDIRKITVIGSGTMGCGIAYVSALAGFATTVHDVDPEALERARTAIDELLAKAVARGRLDDHAADEARSRLVWEPSLEPAVAGADAVIEAVPESAELKKELFAQVDVFCESGALIASNTSSLSISELAGSVERRDRFIGLHFFNPVHVMKLLEIVAGERTSAETIADARALAAALGKEPILVRDVPGFATSRLGIALGMEAIRMVEDGVASATDIDRAMQLGYNHPIGPLELTDLVGLDVRLSIAEYLASTLGPRFEPPELLRQMVHEGRLGKKSGRGFYDWADR